MRVALLTTFAASRKEPLAEALQRVHRGFLDASLGEPVVRFNFGDGPPVAASIVDRVLKRHPELERFVTDADPAPGIRGARRISNGPAVTEWKKGDRVGVGWHGGHDFVCPSCRRGDFITCANETITGLQETLQFSQFAGVRPMIETYPLAKVKDAYERMTSGHAEFRVVLTMD